MSTRHKLRKNEPEENRFHWTEDFLLMIDVGVYSTMPLKLLSGEGGPALFKKASRANTFILWYMILFQVEFVTSPASEEHG